MNEAANQTWSTRALDRQISTLYYERLLASQDRVAVADEAARNIDEFGNSPREFVRDPVMLEFLGLSGAGKLLESSLEAALIENLLDVAYDTTKDAASALGVVGLRAPLIDRDQAGFCRTPRLRSNGGAEGTCGHRVRTAAQDGQRSCGVTTGYGGSAPAEAPLTAARLLHQDLAKGILERGRDVRPVVPTSIGVSEEEASQIIR